MVADATSAIQTLAAFQRRVADLRDPAAALDALGDALAEELGLAVAIVVTEDGVDATAAYTKALPPEIATRLEEAMFLDSRLGETLARGLELDWNPHTWLLVSDRNLFGAAVVFREQPLDPTSAAMAQSLVDASALALHRIHTQRALEDTIDELRRSKAELARAHALEALGKMAAVIAHEVRNPLASIGGVLQILQGRAAEDSIERKMFEKVLVRLGELNDLLTEILGYARPQSSTRKPVALDGLVAEAVAAFRADPAHQAVEVSAETVPVQVHADAAQVRGVLDNLLLNASQAMEDAGAIRVSLEDEGGRCTLRVDDNGPGIPPEVRDSLFEPFVTTKVKGTGLGLAMVARVIEDHDGSICVDEAPEGGARFLVVLPTL